MGIGYNAQLNIEPATIPLAKAMDLCVVFMQENRIEAFKTHAAYAHEFIKNVQTGCTLILDANMGTVYESDEQKSSHRLQVTKLSEQFYAIQDGKVDMDDPLSFGNGILINAVEGTASPYTNEDHTCPMLHDGLRKSSMINWIISRDGLRVAS